MGMTEQEAKLWLKVISCTLGVCPMKEQKEEALVLGMKALEKQIAKKPIINKRSDGTYYKCPICESSVTIEIDRGWEDDYRLDHCEYCGQKLDWGE